MQTIEEALDYKRELKKNIKLLDWASQNTKDNFWDTLEREKDRLTFELQAVCDFLDHNQKNNN